MIIIMKYLFIIISILHQSISSYQEWRPHISVRDSSSSSFNHPLSSLSSSQLANSVESTVSNYAPVLQVSSSIGYLDDRADIGTTVRVSSQSHSQSLQIIVSDADLKAGMPPATYQYILTGLGSTIFAVDQRGFVYLNVNSIDSHPPNPSTYQLTVEAREVDTVPIRSSSPLTITIHIVNHNDNAPQFEIPILSTQTTPSGGLRGIVKIEAKDKDDGIYGKVTHQITQVDGSKDTSLFIYDETSNMLMTKEDLVPGKSYQVLINETNGGGISSQVIIIVNVIDIPLYTSIPSIQSIPSSTLPTSLSSYSTDEETIQTIVTEISENVPINTLVLQLGDNKGFMDVYYTIEGGNDEGKFDIDRSTGSIHTISSFDREITSIYSLQIESRSLSSNEHLYWTLVQISITDVNDNSPLFIGQQPIPLDYTVEDLTQLTRNGEVGKITVTDADDGDNGKIELGVLSPHDRLFTINSNGIISINGEFTAEHIGEHRIMVFARDHGSPPRESLASVIININTSPQIEIVTESPEIFSYYTYSPESTERTTNHIFPIDEVSTSSLESIETDRKEERLGPVFNPPSITVAIEENRADIEIAKVVAGYPDGLSGSITYIMIEGDDNTFKVDSYTGSIRLIRPLDAETQKNLIIIVSTKEITNLVTNPVLAHNVSVMILIGDSNDWIPTFESSHYSFSVRSDTQPGTIIGQTTAFDEDRDSPNNDIVYSIVSGGEGHFNVNKQSGLITLAKSLEGLEGQQIKLKIEGRDGGEPSQSVLTMVMIIVEENDIGKGINEIIDEVKEDNRYIRFTQKNYTASVSESVRPPYLIMTIPIENKGDGTFITCSITNGNYRGSFGVTSNGGNCELRTQMELDRETIERHLLNISVSSSSGYSDWTIIHIIVLDTNDNSPIFIYDNDLSLLEYFAGVSSDAGPFTKVTTVKASDADIGNSSLVRYSLDALSLHSKYFSISSNGDISTRQSMTQLLHLSKMDKFELKILACDSATTGQQLCSRSKVTIVIVKDDNRIRISISGMNPSQLVNHQMDIIRSIRPSMGRCSLLLMEKMTELTTEMDGKSGTNLTFYSIDPIARRICNKDDIKSVFDRSSIQMISGKLRPWFSLNSIASEADELKNELNSEWNVEWKGASALLLSISILIAIGALIAACTICFFYTRYKRSQNHSLPHSFPNAYPPAKLGTIFLPNPTMQDKMYETQMLEMPMSEEDLTMKGRESSGDSRTSRDRERVNYRSYGRDIPMNYEGDFSVEESMYALNTPARFDLQSKRNIIDLDGKVSE